MVGVVLVRLGAEANFDALFCLLGLTFVLRRLAIVGCVSVGGQLCFILLLFVCGVVVFTCVILIVAENERFPAFIAITCSVTAPSPVFWGASAVFTVASAFVGVLLVGAAISGDFSV